MCAAWRCMAPASGPSRARGVSEQCDRGGEHTGTAHQPGLQRAQRDDLTVREQICQEELHLVEGGRTTHVQHHYRGLRAVRHAARTTSGPATGADRIEMQRCTRSDAEHPRDHRGGESTRRKPANVREFLNERDFRCLHANLINKHANMMCWMAAPAQSVPLRTYRTAPCSFKLVTFSVSISLPACCADPAVLISSQLS